MQKQKIENFYCSSCFGEKAQIMLDCFCLFCTNCFTSLNIAKIYEEKQRNKKEKSSEKCQRCSRSTEFKIYNLENKTHLDQIRFLFNSATTSLMPVYKVLEFQFLQKNREINYLSLMLKRICKKVNTLLSENFEMTKYFDETDIKCIKNKSKNLDIEQEQVDQNSNSSLTNINNRKQGKTLKETSLNEISISKGNDKSNKNIILIETQETDPEPLQTPISKTKLNKEIERIPQQNLHSSRQELESSIPREKSAAQASKSNQFSNNKISMQQPPVIDDIERRNMQTPIDKTRNNKMPEKNAIDPSLAMKRLVGYQPNDYETPIPPQLKKVKINDNAKEAQKQREELKKLFGFEVKEIKKTNSGRPSTEKKPEDTQTPTSLKPQMMNQISYPIKNQNQYQSYHQQQLHQSNLYQNKNQYWGSGYHLNYPSYR